MVKNQKSKLLSELIFWFHTLIIVAIVLSGLFVAWWWVLLILVVVKTQQWLFHGCVLTVFEAYEGGIAKGKAYYQQAAQRFFGVKLSRHGVHVVFWLHFGLTAAVSAIATMQHLRVHL